MFTGYAKLKNIVVTFPSAPKEPMKRKEFIYNLLFLGISAFFVSSLANFVAEILLGGNAFFIAFVLGAIMLPFTYLVSSLYAARLLDIKPNINPLVPQIAFFAVLIILNILYAINEIVIGKIKTELNTGGAYEVSDSVVVVGQIAAIGQTIIGISLLFIVIFLLFKKGKEA